MRPLGLRLTVAMPILLVFTFGTPLGDARAGVGPESTRSCSDTTPNIVFVNGTQKDVRVAVFTSNSLCSASAGIIVSEDDSGCSGPTFGPLLTGTAVVVEVPRGKRLCLVGPGEGGNFTYTLDILP